MLLEKERKEVMEYGRRMIKEGLTKGTGGNISLVNREQILWQLLQAG